MLFAEQETPEAGVPIHPGSDGAEILLKLGSRLGLDAMLEQFILHLGGLLDGLLGLGLPTPNAYRLLSRGFLVASGAFERGGRLSLLGFNVGPMRPGDLPLGILREYRNIPGGDFRAAFPSVMILQMHLRDVLAGEIRCTRFPHSGERRLARRRDIGVLRRSLEDLCLHLIGYIRAIAEVTPKGGIGVRPPGVLIEPLADVWNARDHDHGSLAGLAIDGSGEAVLVVGNITDGHSPDFPGAESGIPCHRNQGFIPGLVGRVDHREDMLLPLVHVRGVRHRLVIPARCATDLLDARRPRFGIVGILAADERAEPPERPSIIPVGFLVLVESMNPANEVLGGLHLIERINEAGIRELLGIVFLRIPGKDRKVLEEFQMAAIRILGFPESELIGELDERLRILGIDGLGGLDAISNRIDLLVEIGHAVNGLTQPFNVNLWLNAGPTHSTKRSILETCHYSGRSGVNGGVPG